MGSQFQCNQLVSELQSINSKVIMFTECCCDCDPLYRTYAGLKLRNPHIQSEEILTTLAHFLVLNSLVRCDSDDKGLLQSDSKPEENVISMPTHATDSHENKIN